MYNKICIIGYGKIAIDCLSTALQYVKDIDVVVYEAHQLSALEMMAEQYNLKLIKNTRKQFITDYFMGLTERTLVVSANNNYLFPPEVVARKNLFIINFHSALLPFHRGRNAQTWAIYEQEEKTGISWHVVDEQVDNGDLLIQKEIAIEANTRALDLTREGMKQGSQAFREILPDLLAGFVSRKPQAKSENIVLHLSGDVPNNGYLDLTWPINKISAFLRSLDYGKMKVFDDIHLKLDGKKLPITSYRLIETEEPGHEIHCNNNHVIIQDENLKIEITVNNHQEK